MFQNVDIAYLLNLLDTGWECVNAIKIINNGGKVYFKGKNGYRIPVKIISNNLSSDIQVYRGGNLITLYNNLGISKMQARNFVRGIKAFVSNRKFDTICAICGLRSLGKTVGMLQSLSYINKPDLTAYINVSNSISYKILDKQIDELVNNGVKYIGIDEITLVNDFLTSKLVTKLSDVYARRGVKIIITGTNSLALLAASGGILCHRVNMFYATTIYYKESVQTLGLSINEYLNIGGMYKPQILLDGGLYWYIQTSIIDNIKSTVYKNTLITNNFTDQQLCKLIFLIIYRITFDNINLSSNRVADQVINLFDHSVIPGTPRERLALLNNIIAKNYNFSSDIVIDELQKNTVVNILEQSNLLIHVNNIVNNFNTETRYYISTQAMSNIICGQIVDYLLNNVNNDVINNGTNIRIGFLFELAVIIHAISYAESINKTAYFYKDSVGRELDLIIEYENEVDLFEIKSTSDIDKAIEKSRWLYSNDVCKALQMGGYTVTSKSIIYNGKTTTFSGKNSSLPDIIIKEALGIDLINIEDFLLNTGNYINFAKKL